MALWEPPHGIFPTGTVEQITPVAHSTPVGSPKSPEKPPQSLDEQKSVELRLASFYLRAYYDSFLETFYVAVSRTPENEVTAPLDDWFIIVDKANANISLGNTEFHFDVNGIGIRAFPDYANRYMWRDIFLEQAASDGRQKQMNFSKADYRHFRCRLPILPQLQALIMDSDLYDPNRDRMIYTLSNARKGVIFYKGDLEFEIFAPPFCSLRVRERDRDHLPEPYIEIRDGDFFLNFQHVRLDQRMCKKIDYVRHLDKAVINLVDPLDNVLKVAIFRNTIQSAPIDEYGNVVEEEPKPKDYITFTDVTWPFLEKCIEFFLSFTLCEANIDDVALYA